MKPVIAIILVVQELNFVVQACGERFGGEEGMGAQNSVPLAALSKQRS